MNHYNNLQFSDTGIITDYLYNGQQDRIDELNTRIYNRFVPDAELQPNFDPRPNSLTKEHLIKELTSIGF